MKQTNQERIMEMPMTMKEFREKYPPIIEELRDRFAMFALQGMTANDLNNVAPPKMLAMAAYQLADAMLEARKKCP